MGGMVRPVLQIQALFSVALNWSHGHSYLFNALSGQTATLPKWSYGESQSNCLWITLCCVPRGAIIRDTPMGRQWPMVLP